MKRLLVVSAGLLLSVTMSATAAERTRVRDGGGDSRGSSQQRDGGAERGSSDRGGRGNRNDDNDNQAPAQQSAPAQQANPAPATRHQPGQTFRGYGAGGPREQGAQQQRQQAEQNRGRGNNDGDNRRGDYNRGDNNRGGDWDRNDRDYGRNDRRDGRDGRGHNDRRDGRWDNDRHDGRRDGRHGNRYGSRDYRDFHRYRGGWNNNRYRSNHRYVYPRGYSSRHWSVGLFLPSVFFGSTYYVDYRPYGLQAPPYGFRWIRVGDDVMLVDVDSGEIVDVLYDFYY
jgi:Ni/Co efflux regulator RcnB